MSTVTVSSIFGNIFKKYHELKEPELLVLDRREFEKNRIRKKTNKGTDVKIILESEKLQDGDILSCEGKTILVHQKLEKVVAIHPIDPTVKLLVLIGHIIGNMHRPVSINLDRIYVPISSDSELETFEKLFSDVNVDLFVQDIVFKPLGKATKHV